jgi:hypothetical protein
VSKTALLLGFIVCSLGFLVSAVVTSNMFARIAKEVNQVPGVRKIPSIGLSTPTTVMEMFEQHREHYPNSPVRLRLWICTACVIVFTFIQGSLLRALLR